MHLRANTFTTAGMLLLGVFVAVLLIESMNKRDSLKRTEVQGVDAREIFLVPLTKEDVPLREPENVIDTNDLVSKRIIGGVVPHHLLASELLVEFFRCIADRPEHPKTIVLLAPNHFESGLANLQTVDFRWHTPYGEVETDRDTLHDLLEATTTEVAPQSFEAEHGIFSILPYIARFLPSTRIVPVIFRYNTSAEEIDDLVTFLKPLVETGEVLVIGSVDFSHYLPKEMSDAKDRETMRAMQNYDLSQIADFRSDHMDSPPTILTLLQLGQATDAKDIRILRHDNSADDARGSHDSTTGHFSLFLTGPDE